MCFSCDRVIAKFILSNEIYYAPLRHHKVANCTTVNKYSRSWMPWCQISTCLHRVWSIEFLSNGNCTNYCGKRLKLRKQYWAVVLAIQFEHNYQRPYTRSKSYILGIIFRRLVAAPHRLPLSVHNKGTCSSHSFDRLWVFYMKYKQGITI